MSLFLSSAILFLSVDILSKLFFSSSKVLLKDNASFLILYNYALILSLYILYFSAYPLEVVLC